VIFRSATRSNLTIALDTNCKSGAAESGPTRYTHEPAPHQALGPPEPTTTGPGPNSTQKTSLMVEDCPHLYVVLPHHQFPMCALRGNEPPANLHAAEQRSDLPRRTCMITDDNGDTIFVNEVQPKSTSRGMTMGAPPQITTPAAPDPGNTPPSPASLSLCRHGYNSSPLSYL
jgi:hypothetical protein